MSAVTRADDEPHGRLLATAPGLRVYARIVVSATGTWDQPFWPNYPGAGEFHGRQLHASQYRKPEDFTDQHVLVIGGGNSAAQILAEVSIVADTTWVTPRDAAVPARRRRWPSPVLGRHRTRPSPAGGSVNTAASADWATS